VELTLRRMVIGMSGASGLAYGIELLRQLRALHVETHLVVTRPARMTRAYETDYSESELRGLADVTHASGDVGAAIASGSFRTMGMIVAPCSMHSLAEIAMGASSDLLTRAAEVTLKERRRLVLLTREAPLTLANLRNMVAATESGAIIYPPVPAFYLRPRDLDEVVAHTAGRVLDLFGLEVSMARWGEPLPDGLSQQ
jgi:flavin prenyltransferase